MFFIKIYIYVYIYIYVINEWINKKNLKFTIITAVKK